jgi:hypothetical protein
MSRKHDHPPLKLPLLKQRRFRFVHLFWVAIAVGVLAAWLLR